MTFIGFTCKGDTAEVVTDEVGYSAQGARFRKTAKQQQFSHLDAVMVTSGHGPVAKHASWHADFAANNSDTFDQFVENVPAWYGYALADANFDSSNVYGMSGSMFLVGYSHDLGEFAAYAVDTHDTTPRRITAAHLQPMPYSLRPAPSQLRTFIRGIRTMGVPEDEIQSVHAAWSSRPVVPQPESPQDWIDLAVRARNERSLNGPFMRVWIAGKLHLTRLERGGVDSRAIFEFDDEGELDDLVRGSLHPVAQLAPCTDCDSGTPALDCCLLEYYGGKPCDCGGPHRLLFEDCCMVRDRETVQRQLWSPPAPYALS